MKNYLVRNSRTGRECDSFCRKSQNIHTNRTYIKYGDRWRMIKTSPRNEKSSDFEATLQSHIAFRGDKKILLDIQLSDRVNNNEAGVPHFCIASINKFFRPRLVTIQSSLLNNINIYYSRGGVHQLNLSPQLQVSTSVELQVSTSVEVSSFLKVNYNLFKISAPSP